MSWLKDAVLVMAAVTPLAIFALAAETENLRSELTRERYRSVYVLRGDGQVGAMRGMVGSLDSASSAFWHFINRVNPVQAEVDRCQAEVKGLRLVCGDKCVRDQAAARQADGDDDDQ